MTTMTSPVRSIALVLVLTLFAAAAAAAQEPPPDVTERYRIEASDLVVVKYRYTPEYDHEAHVQPDGFITLPLIGEVKIGGLTLAEATEAIRTQASTRLRDPEITVQLKDFQRPRFFVGGEVGEPGEFVLRGRIGVLEAITMAGGFKPTAKHSQVLHLRRVDDAHAVRTVLDVKKLARSGEAQDIELQPGDLLYVPQNRISKILTTIVPLAGPLVSLGVLLDPLVD
jgi:polysaccharide export outer membrane protein